MKKMRKVLSLIVVAIMIAATASMTASASNYNSGNTTYRDLNVPYHYYGTHQNMRFNMKYSPGNIWSYTDAQLGLGPATGKAYTAMIPRGVFFRDKAQIQSSSYVKATDGYVKTSLSGSDINANCVMHSATSNVVWGWRIDYRYMRG